MEKLYGINLIAVLIDAYENHELRGRIMHPWSEEAISFVSCMELMEKMEALYDAWDYPEAAQSTRVFIRHRSEATPQGFASEKRLTELSKEQAPRDIWGERGRLASVFVRTEMRQHASWQGVAAWIEGDRSFVFSSTLELFRAIDQIVSQEGKLGEAVL